MLDYEKKCAERLNELVISKLEEFQDEIDLENKRIQEVNKKNREHAKITGNSIGMIMSYSKKDKFTQKQLVKEINHETGLHLTQQMLHLYCIQKSYPPISVLYKLAEYFNVSFDYLAGLSDEKNPENLTAQQLINLDDNAINTLLYLTNKTDTRDALNALLTDKYFLRNIISSISLHMYQKQLLEARKNAYLPQDKYVEQRNHLYLERFTDVASLYDYWEQNLIPLLQPTFDAEIPSQIQEDLYKINNYDQYCNDLATIEIPDNGDISITVTAITPKDSQ